MSCRAAVDLADVQFEEEWRKDTFLRNTLFYSLTFCPGNQRRSSCPVVIIINLMMCGWDVAVEAVDVYMDSPDNGLK